MPDPESLVLYSCADGSPDGREFLVEKVLCRGVQDVPLNQLESSSSSLRCALLRRRLSDSSTAGVWRCGRWHAVSIFLTLQLQPFLIMLTPRRASSSVAGLWEGPAGDALNLTAT